MKLVAQATGYVQGMERASKATRDTASEAERLAQKGDAFNTLGQAAVGFGVVATAAVGMAIKAAIDWETAWTGVLKTVEGTEPVLQQLEGDLRGLAQTLPASHAEIAAVAEAAGQLGIQTSSVASFTKTMIDLGETTNLSANDAATSLARFMNVMGTAQGDVGRLGSAVVELGNNYATTEAEILEMSMRLAGAGRQIGLSEGQVLGLATSLSSVGIEAEAGGSAISKVMIDIASQVANGGEKLEMFATTAGMSADEFSRKWQTEPGEALAAFVAGLSDAERQGGSTLQILEQLGITEVRMRDALLRSASASDQFTAAMETGNDAIEANTALTEEAEKRYATAGAQIEVTKNQVVDAAIGFGEVLMPAVSAAAETVGTFAQALGGLPEPMKVTVGVAGAVTAAVALSGGAFFLAVPKIAAYKSALATMGPTAQRANRAMVGMGKALGVIAGAGAAVLVLDQIATGGRRAGAGVEQFTEALLRADLDSLFAEIGADVEDVDSALNLLFGNDINANMERFGSTLNGIFFGGQLSDQVLQTRDAFDKTGQALANLVNAGDANRAQSMFLELADTAREQGISYDELMELMPAYSEALAGVRNGQQLAVDSAEDNAAALDEITDAAGQTRESMNKLADSLSNFGDAQFAADDALFAFKDSLLAIDELMGEDGFTGTLDLATEEGIANSKALRDIAGSANEAAAGVLAAGGAQEDANVILEEGRAKIAAVGEAFGLSGDELQDFIDTYVASPQELAYEASVLGIANMQDQLDTFRKEWDGRKITMRFFADTYNLDKGAAAAAARYTGQALGYASGYADGGAVRGPGGPRDDRVLIRASAGEHVFDAGDVAAMGGQDAVYRFREALHRPDPVRMFSAPPSAATVPVSGPSVEELATAVAKVVRPPHRSMVDIAPESINALAGANTRNQRRDAWSRGDA